MAAADGSDLPMTKRDALCDAFLSATECAGWRRDFLAGDASNRRYDRLTAVDGRTVVLMDAPPERGETVLPFVRIANHLRNHGFSAPEVLAQDTQQGFLLLEDLGDDLFAKVICHAPDLEQQLYAAATDALTELHRAPLPQLEPYGPRVLAELSGLVIEKYRGGITGDHDTELQSRVEHQLEDILNNCLTGSPVLVQRDYHAENLLWLPERTGVARVGMLDFQDARAGHRAFDLVSLLQDARRDVPAAIETQMIARYIAANDVTPEAFTTAYSVLGVMRSLRILGVFARLSRDYGKPHYLGFVPRVWAHLLRGLAHPAMTPVAELLLNCLPAPTPENLNKLRP